MRSPGCAEASASAIVAAPGSSGTFQSVAPLVPTATSSSQTQASSAIGKRSMGIWVSNATARRRGLVIWNMIFPPEGGVGVR